MSFTLITGASSGIGQEFARQYAKRGHSLILVARSEDKLQALASELTTQFQVKVHVIAQDLGRNDSAEQLFKKCNALGVEINFLINDAGIGLIGDFETHDLSKIEEMLLLNVLTVTKITYLFLPQLKKNQGVLLNVASQVAYEPAPYMAAYGGTKAYVLSFTEALRVELKDSVKVTALCPGPTYTNFFARADSSPNDINFKFRTPKEVVEAAIAGVDSNTSTVIPGWENQLFSFFTRFLPKNVLATLSQYNVKK